ncbi:hypothetical protein ACFW0H_04370 [Pseudomonas sp. CR3202]|uniref:hypothetical protein n=1 Tax=Pseudomonas sp. CR3202 TaxID=3351532 RepID=UPI003BF3AEC2
MVSWHSDNPGSKLAVDNRLESTPGHYLYLLCQKAFAPGMLAPAGVLGIREFHIGHAIGLGVSKGAISANREGPFRIFADLILDQFVLPTQIERSAIK